MSAKPTPTPEDPIHAYSEGYQDGFARAIQMLRQMGRDAAHPASPVKVGHLLALADFLQGHGPHPLDGEEEPK